MSVPSVFIIDVNWDCNFNCPMCVKRTLKKPYGQKPVTDFITLANKLPTAKSISIGALGDPFSYKGLDKALRYLDGRGIMCPLTTNGSLITKKNLNYLPHDTPLFISIDAGSEELYQKIQKSTLAKIKKNIELIQKVRPDIRLQINYLLFKHNIQDAKKLVDYLSKSALGITFFFPMYFEKEVEKKYSAFYLGNKLIVQMMELAMYCEKKGVRYSMTSPYKKERGCIRASNFPIVAYDGTVYPCDYVYQNMNDWKHPTWNSYYLGKPTLVPQYQYKMGNLYKEEFIDMWNSEKWKRLRELVNRLNLTGNKEEIDMNKEFEHCKVCLARLGRCL